MAIFEKLRISLAPRDVGPLDELLGDVRPRMERKEFLRMAFSEPLTFNHLRTGRPIDFVPIEVEGEYAGGIFRRSAPVHLQDQSLEPYEAENFEGSVFIMSLSKDQTAWMQSNKRLGATRGILESFFDHVFKKIIYSEWSVYVRHFEIESDYFEVIKTRRAEIAKITFTFVPPNALGADDAVYSFIKAFAVESSPEIQQHIYKAEPGRMNPDSAHMNASAVIAMEGGGEVDVRDGKNRVLYNPQKAKVTMSVPDEDLPTPSPSHAPFLRRVRDWLFDL